MADIGAATRRATDRSITAATITTRPNIIALATNTASCAEPIIEGSRRAACAIAAVTAVELVKPPTSPATPAPRCSPHSRLAT